MDDDASLLLGYSWLVPDLPMLRRAHHGRLRFARSGGGTSRPGCRRADPRISPVRTYGDGRDDRADIDLPMAARLLETAWSSDHPPPRAHLVSAGAAPRRRLPGSVVITADDGHASVFTEMLPVVREYHVPVTLFIYPSAIANASYAMTWQQLDALQHTGLFDIQSHTFWHPNFKNEKRRLSPAAYRTFTMTQLVKSRTVLEDRLGVEADLIAWPFGIYDDELLAMARDAGLRRGLHARSTDRDRARTPPCASSLSGDGRRRRARLRVDAARGKPMNRRPVIGLSILARCWRAFHFATADAAIRVNARVVDAVSRAPVADAIVTTGRSDTRSDSSGLVAFDANDAMWSVSAPLATCARRSRSSRFSTRPRNPADAVSGKGAVSVGYGIGDRTLRGAALRLLETTELNALVIDLKGDRGLVPYRSGFALAARSARSV